MSRAQKFNRECENRTQSERLLDKFLLRQEHNVRKQEARETKDDLITKKVHTSKTALFNKNLLTNEENSQQDKILFAQQGSSKKAQEQKQQIQQASVENQGEQKPQEQVVKKQINILETLIKLQQFIQQPGKAVKALQTLHKLVIKNSQKISLNQSLDILLVIIQNREQFKRAEQKKQTKEIFEAILNENQTNFGLYFQEEIKILKLYFIEMYELETDDSFKFSKIVKKFQQVLEEIPQDKIELSYIQDGLKKDWNNRQQRVDKEVEKIQKEKEDILQLEIQQQKEKEKQSQKMSIRDKLKKKKEEEEEAKQQKKDEEEQQKLESQQTLQSQQTLMENDAGFKILPEYEYKISEYCQKFLDDYKIQLQLKIQIYIGFYRELLKFYKYDWAKANINQIYTEVQFNQRFIFEKEIQDEIEELGGNWMDLKNGDTALKIKRSQMEQGIGQIGQSKTEVKDGRTESILIGNGAQTWGNRQNGL